jgi:hypothetical protein
VAVDQRGNDGFAREIYADGAGRRLALAGAANEGEALAFDEKRCVVDRRRAVSDEQPAAFEP